MSTFKLAAFVVALAGATPAFAATDYLLTIEGVPGESKSTASEPIALDSFSWGGAAPACPGRSGAGQASIGGAALQSSPTLRAVAATGKVIPKATLFGRKAGDDKRSDYTLENVMVTSLAPAPGGRPNGAATLKFASASCATR